MDNNDDVRPPDPVIRETLIEDIYNNNKVYNNVYNNEDNEETDFDRDLKLALQISTNYDTELNIALELSKDEFNLSEKIRLQKEEETREAETLRKMIETERNNRTKILDTIKNKIIHVKSFEHSNKNIYIYNSIISIIEQYKAGILDTFVLDNESYTSIFKIINSIRFNKEDVNLLRDIICQL